MARLCCCCVVEGLGSLGFNNASGCSKDSTNKKLRKWLARWNCSVKKGPGSHGVQQCYRKKGEEQGKGSGRLRYLWRECVRVCKTTDTRRRLPILPTLIHRDDESYFPTTIWRIFGCVRRFIARKAGFYPSFFPRRLRSGGRAIFPLILV